MASRTYIPTLKFITYQIIKYVGRYREQINKNLSPEAQTLLDALLAAAQALADALPDQPVGP